MSFCSLSNQLPLTHVRVRFISIWIVPVSFLPVNFFTSGFFPHEILLLKNTFYLNYTHQYHFKHQNLKTIPPPYYANLSLNIYDHTTNHPANEDVNSSQLNNCSYLKWWFNSIIISDDIITFIFILLSS